MTINSKIAEELNNKIIRISCEDFNLIKTEKGSRVVGIALPFNKVSRNQFTYVTESIQNARKTMENKPVLFNHDPDIIIGHNLSSQITTEGLGYEVDINPKAINTRTLVPFVESIERGDLKKVSIQCIYDENKSFTDEAGITHAYINEFLEMSFVSIPGFEDTTAQLIESFKLKKTKGEIIMETKKEDVKIPEVPAQEKKQDAPEAPKVPETKKEEAPEDPMKKIDDRITGIENRLGSIEKWMKEQADDEEKPKDEKPKDEEQPKESVDEDAKREEAIRNDKQAVSAESLEQSRTITSKELKKAFMEVLK